MKLIYRWKAKRAGGRITVTGYDTKGAAIKIVGIDTIEPNGSNQVVAKHFEGKRYVLVV